MDNTSSSNSSRNAILGILAALLIGSNGYWLCNKQKTDSQATQLGQVTMELDKESKLRAEVDKNYYESLAQLEEMRGSNADLNKVIDAQKASIMQQKAKIDNLMKTKKDFAAAQIELDNLRGLMAGYKAEIETLSKDKAALTVRVAEVTKEKEQVAAELGTVSAERAVLATEKTELTTAKQNLEAQNDTYLTELKRVPVKVLSAEPKYRDKSGKLKSNTSMRTANVVEVVLELGDNERSEPGNEQFFIQVMNPVGEPVNVAGKFQNAKDKTEIRYTKAFTYDYSKKKKQVTALVDMEGMSNKNNGTYDFKVFNKGYYAGEGSFKLDF